MKISIIAAIGKNRELGKNNKLLWHIPEDFKRFKALTSGHPIIMGRKTWDSLPLKPLPNRTNIVISRNPVSSARRRLAEPAGSVEEALREAQGKPGSEEVFIIGGGQIYKQAIKEGLVDKLYLTIVDGDFDADTFFPDYSEFKKVASKEEHDNGEYKYKFLELEK